MVSNEQIWIAIAAISVGAAPEDRVASGHGLPYAMIAPDPSGHQY